MLPSLENLRCFAAAARLLNFRAAARSVALTPAAFGQRIKQLEGEVGATLFQRTTRSVALTEAGRCLVPAAERALAAAADCGRAARGELGPPPADVTLGTRQELGLSWIVARLDALEAAQPGLTLHLYFGSGPDLILRVRTLEIDCAVTSLRFTDPKLDELRLHREDYAFVGAPGLLAERPLRRPEDAGRHALLDASADLPLFRYLREAPDGAGAALVFERIVRLGTIAAIRARVLAGAGVAVLPRYFVEDDLAAGRLKRILPRVALAHDWFRLVFRADDPRRPVYEQLARGLMAQPLR